MKHRGLAVCLGLAALATGAVALAEAEDALLRRYPYDPACAWGRVGNGKGMVVRCITEEEAKTLRQLAAPPAAQAKPALGGAPLATPATTTAAPETDAAPAVEPVTPEAGSETLDVTVGPVTADEGSLGVGKLSAPRDKYLACVQKNGGLSAKTGEVSVRFLVRAKGIAEGVSVAKRQNVSKEAAQCVAEVIDRRRVGTPDSPMLGATVLVKFARVEK